MVSHERPHAIPPWITITAACFSTLLFCDQCIALGVEVRFASVLFTKISALLRKSQSKSGPIIRTTPNGTLTYSDRWIVCARLTLRY